MTTSGNLLLRRRVILCTALFVGAVSVYFALGWGVFYWKEYTHHYEAGVVAELFALHTMQENYKNDHGSYAGTFSELGTPLGAKLNSDLLTWNGPYRFPIIQVVRDRNGAVLEYCIEARHMTYTRGSERSYLMEYNGTIHFTSVNRHATMEDPSIQTKA